LDHKSAKQEDAFEAAEDEADGEYPACSNCGKGADHNRKSRRNKKRRPATAKPNADHRKKARHVLGGRVPAKDVALAEAPNMSNPPPKEQVAARKRVASAFYKENGQEYSVRDKDGNLIGKDANGNAKKALRKPTDQERRNQLAGADMNHPVVVGPPPPCQRVQHQQQVPGADRGNYFGPKGQTADQSGIAPEGRAWTKPGHPIEDKVETAHVVSPDAKYLNTTNAAANDTWSVPKDDTAIDPARRVYPTKGGGNQTYIPDGCDPNSNKVIS
jgi:hypothetical protein